MQPLDCCVSGCKALETVHRFSKDPGLRKQSIVAIKGFYFTYFFQIRGSAVFHLGLNVPVPAEDSGFKHL